MRRNGTERRTSRTNRAAGTLRSGSFPSWGSPMRPDLMRPLARTPYVRPRGRLLVLSAVVAVSLAIPAITLADYGLTLRHQTVQSRETVTVFGNACSSSRASSVGMPIYLVPSAVQNSATLFAPRPPASPYRRLGRMRCTSTPHPWGDGGFWDATLRFRVPAVRPGRYQLVIYCDVCHHGRGGNLIVNDWYFNGRRRTALDALTIR